MIKKINLAVLEGDGIGKEVTQAALPIFEALKLPIAYQKGDIGWEYWITEANPIPQRTWDLIAKSDAVLLGATTSKPDKEAQAELRDKSKAQSAYTSPLIQLRQKLDLFANVRPCFPINKNHHFNLCIIRENTEGLYSGVDFETLPPQINDLLINNERWSAKLNEQISCTLRLQSTSGLKRIYNFAFEYAQQHEFSRVSLADKPNVLRNSSKLSRQLFEEAASSYPQIKAEILNVDAVAMHLLTKPQRFGVIVAENMFGDILSDVGAGIMGGLGLAPSANIGKHQCYFEPVHGSGPSMPANTANPSAMFLSISLLLSHFGLHRYANIVKQAVINVIQEAKCITKDLSGNATTINMAQAIINEAVYLDAKTNTVDGTDFS